MNSLPTIDLPIDKQIGSFTGQLEVEAENTKVYFEKIFGANSLEATILAQLYVLSKNYKLNLKSLIPIMQGAATLQSGGYNGKVILNMGEDKGRRYYSVEVRRVLEQVIDPIDGVDRT